MSQLTALEWLALLHPVLAILFVYPVAGATIRLGILAREKRTDYNPALPDTVPTEHWQHGRWLVSSAVVITLWSYLVIAWRNGLGLNPMLWPPAWAPWPPYWLYGALLLIRSRPASRCSAGAA